MKYEIKSVRKSTANFRAGLGKTKIYVSIANESVLENLSNRRSWHIAELRKIVSSILDMAKIGDGPFTAKWSQRAGCGCGCSPGFIVDGSTGFNIWVEVRAVK